MISHHWSKYSLDTYHAISHYLNQCWPSSMSHIALAQCWCCCPSVGPTLAQPTGWPHYNDCISVVTLTFCLALFLTSTENFPLLIDNKLISLAPERYGNDSKGVTSKHILQIMFMGTSCKIALRWIAQNTFDDKSALVEVIAWRCQAPSHFVSQCWPRSMSPYGITRPQWVKKYDDLPPLINPSLSLPGLRILRKVWRWPWKW